MAVGGGYLVDADPLLRKAREYRILDMQTLGLGANYTEQITQAVSYIRDVMVKVNRGICVVPDKTGAGDAVTDTLAQGLGEAKLPYPLTLRPIHIKPSGSYTLNTHSGYNVSIADIIHNAAVLFQQGQVHIAADIPTIHRAIKELQRFKIKKTRGGGETYEAWREGDHDDLVFSLALPLWVAEKRLGYPAYVDLKGHVIADASVNIRERH